MDCSMPGFPVLHCLPEFAQIYAHCVSMGIQPSHSLPPFLLLPSIFCSIRVFSSESALQVRWPEYWSLSFSSNASKEYSGLGGLKSFSAFHSRLDLLVAWKLAMRKWEESRMLHTLFTQATGWVVMGKPWGEGKQVETTEGDQAWWLGRIQLETPFDYPRGYIQERVKNLNHCWKWARMEGLCIDGIYHHGTRS